MLFDDDDQLEVRHVVSLAHHDVSIYSGEETTPEGELFIKRNAICLTRRADAVDMPRDGQLSKPFFLFSENCSAKEDFYLALLRNQELAFAADSSKTPTPIQFDVKNIISLVQKLHSSEEHMQTRWLNAMIGRIFLGVYKTKDIENFIREKLTKKISRVKRPAFLSNISIKRIDTGESAPYITNPRLRDLTVEGECCVEADMRYTGNFRLEVAATARIDLGSRFKAREVNLVLAVVVRRLEGHVLFKIKPPPSNRLWFSFSQTPKMEMTIEPIVSSRQITYTVILRQIENRIKEVIAETLVLPFWDDTPFFNTEHKKWRGGIFQDDQVQSTMDLESAVAQEGDLDEVDKLESGSGASLQETDLSVTEKSHSLPVLEKKPSTGGLFGRKLASKASKTDSASSYSASSSSIDIKTNDVTPKAETARSETPAVPLSPPRAVRSASFAHPASPTVETDPTNSEIFKPSSSPPDESSAISAMATLSAKSPTSSSASLAQTRPPSVPSFKPYITSKSSLSVGSQHSASSSSSQEALAIPEEEGDLKGERGTHAELEDQITPKPTHKHRPRRSTTLSSGGSLDLDDGPQRSPSILSSKSSSKNSMGTGTITRGFFGGGNRSRDIAASAPATPPAVPDSPGNSGRVQSHTEQQQHQQKKTALAAAFVTNAAASARRWGLSAIQRHTNNNNNGSDKGEEGAGAGGRPGSSGSGKHNRDGEHQESSEHTVDLKQPMGRGRPLPPPGTPLPMPDKKTRTKVQPLPVPPRRKPIAPPTPLTGSQSAEVLQPQEGSSRAESKSEGGSVGGESGKKAGRRPVPPPPVPKRRLQQQQIIDQQEREERARRGEDEDDHHDSSGMLVVAAPLAEDSEPNTPLSETAAGSVGGRSQGATESLGSSYVKPSVEDTAAAGEGGGGGEDGRKLDNQGKDKTAATPTISDGADDDEYSAWMDDDSLGAEEAGAAGETAKVKDNDKKAAASAS